MTGADDSRVLSLLRTKGLSVRYLDEESRELLRSYLVRVHQEQGVSLSDLAKLIGNKTSGYTSWLCRELGVKARRFEEARLKGIREKRRKYERRPFDGTDEDRAYLMGLREGDLSASVPFNGAVRVSTSTTHPAMSSLFTELFSSYGHVYKHPRYKKDQDSYEWNLSTILDSSFSFLLPKVTPESASVRNENALLAYIAGLVDAEGSVGVFCNGRHTALQLIVYNTDLELVKFFCASISQLGYHPTGPYLDKLEGTVTAKYGIPRRKDYWKAVLARFEEVKSLLQRLPLRHYEKVERKRLALSLELGDSWQLVEPRLTALREGFLRGRDEFVAEARTKFREDH